jgi:hypothetical protein
MLQALRLACRSSVVRRVVLSRSFLAASGICLMFACSDDGSPSGPGTGSGGSAARSGAGGGRSGSGAGSGGSTAASGGSGSSNSRLYGYFNLVLNPPVAETDTAGNTTVLGKLYDGPNPTPMAWQKKDEADDCELDTPNAVLCQPACGSSAVCVSTNDCVPYATAQTAGTVKLTGLGSTELSLDPRANNYQLPAGTNLAYPPCSAGAKIALAADGGGHGSFLLEAECVAPIEAPARVTLTKGQMLALRWTAGTTAGARLHVLLDISQHGTSKGKIECDTDDDGMLDIPPKLVDALLDLGISGFPTVLLTRESESKPATAGTTSVLLNVSAPYRAAIEIPGLTSCSNDSQCPAGQTCLPDLKCG